MANEPQAPQPPQPPRPESAETTLLREEVEHQRKDALEREGRAKALELLKNQVSVAAIILTTALSFIGNVKGDRDGKARGLSGAAESARQQGAELWAYYQTKQAERTSLRIARDSLRLAAGADGDARAVGTQRGLDGLVLTSYEERIEAFDAEAQQIFFRVQELERKEDVSRRDAEEPALAVFRYELGSKLITLALILLSVTILSSKRWLLWCGIALGAVGLLVALDGYFLFL